MRLGLVLVIVAMATTGGGVAAQTSEVPVASDSGDNPNISSPARVLNADVLAGFFPVKKGAWWQYHCQMTYGSIEGTVVLKVVSVVKTLTGTKVRLAIAVKECSGGNEEEPRGVAIQMLKVGAGMFLPERLIIDPDGIRSGHDVLLWFPLEKDSWGSSIGGQQWSFTQQVKRADDGSYLESRVERTLVPPDMSNPNPGMNQFLAPIIAQANAQAAQTLVRVLSVGKGLLHASFSSEGGKTKNSCDLENMGVELVKPRHSK